MAVGLGAWGFVVVWVTVVEVAFGGDGASVVVFVVVWVTVVEVAFGGDGASVVVGSRWWRDSGGGGGGCEM